MNHLRLFTFVAAATVFMAAGQAEERVSLDVLPLGNNSLRWAPAQAGPEAVVPRMASNPVQPSPVPDPSEAATSAPSPGMTLDEFEAMAERNNPTLAQAAARVQALQGEWEQAGLYPNPRAGYKANEINDERQAGQQGAYFGQEFVTNGKLRLARDAATQAIQQAQCAWSSQRQRVVNDVRRAFYDVLVAQRSVELTDQLVRIGQEGTGSAEKLLRAKEVSRVDLLQARIEADSARILAEKARNRHQAAWRNLTAVTGATDMPPARLAGDLQEGLPQFTWDEAVSRVLGSSPELAGARTGVARAEAVLNRQCAERMPNVDVQAGVMYDNATRDPIAEVQVGVPWPVFNRNQGNIRKAQAEVSAARSEVRRVELELQQRLAVAFEQYQNARCQAEKYASEMLPNAQASLDLVTAGYRHGEFNYITLLTSQRTFFQVNLAYVDAIRELRGAAVAIEGNLLGESLQQR